MNAQQATANRLVDSFLARRSEMLAELVFGTYCACPVVGTTARGELTTAHRSACPASVPAGGAS